MHRRNRLVIAIVAAPLVAALAGNCGVEQSTAMGPTSLAAITYTEPPTFCEQYAAWAHRFIRFGDEAWQAEARAMAGERADGYQALAAIAPPELVDDMTELVPAFRESYYPAGRAEGKERLNAWLEANCDFNVIGARDSTPPGSRSSSRGSTTKPAGVAVP